jgi:hypothetical protein
MRYMPGATAIGKLKAMCVPVAMSARARLKGARAASLGVIIVYTRRAVNI